MSTPSRFTKEIYNNILYDKKDYALHCVNERTVTNLSIHKGINVEFDLTIKDDNDFKYRLNGEITKNRNDIHNKNITEMLFNVFWKSTYGWASIKEVKS